MLITLLFTFVVQAFPCDGGMRNIRPTLIPSFYQTGISQQEFLSAIDEFEDYYVNEIDELYRKELIVYKSWGSSTVNAYADQKPGKFEITIFGGLARHPQMTKDGFQLVLCHELGHHLGGLPRKMANKWSSAEGQADYFATTKCLRKLWRKQDHIRAIRKLHIRRLNPYVIQRCQQSFSHPQKRALCLRISIAGLAVAKFLQELEWESIVPKFQTPEKKVVSRTVMTYSSPQCRLDTYFQGSLCSVSADIPFDDEWRQRRGACFEKITGPFGYRPYCWYKPRI